MSNAPTWEGAKCADPWIDPETFFSASLVDAAKAICEPCPLKTQCLEYALENNYEGVWGGTTDDDRKTIKNTREALE
jgi:WhiB family redox-sensing transcriptional regulator